MRLWRTTKEYPEGKFLVVRRDGTIPAWPHFVMGARDPAVPAALRAYANEAARLGFEAEFVQSVREEADAYERYRDAHGSGDPDSGPHRKDNPAVLALMRHEHDLTAYEGPGSASADGDVVTGGDEQNG